MDIPNLVSERLGDEEVEATISLGDEDLVCLTPTRTLVYRGEGLLSDESVEVYSHDIERLRMSAGRRKAKFVLESVDGTDSFSVPSGRADSILTMLVSGMLAVRGIIEAEESIANVFRFSELTLVVTEKRLVKHVGASVFDQDYEEFHYDDVTRLAFEEGRVATQIVLTVGGRQERIKAPADDADKLRQTLEQALFAHYDVQSLSELNETLEQREGSEDTGGEDPNKGEHLSLGDDDISPLVTEETSSDSAGGGRDDTTATLNDESSSVDTVSTEPAGGTAGSSARDTAGADPDDIAAIEEQLAELTTAVTKQNELLRSQQETIEQLIEELRRGR